MASPTIQIGKLVGRLDGGSSRNERLQTLKELRILAKKNSEDVGLFALQKTMDMLRRDGGNVEECQDILELVHRLVENRDNAAATENTILLLSDTSNVELLLDLLEHEDILIGVTASQILTELHSNNGVYLEKSIQQCPDGMNKLLQRLPDSSREEVRNQSIILVQQLTFNNDEMKKTVGFNDGFDLLFNIIASEGGPLDAGFVVQDCLRICQNILKDSETCQRLFYSMGNGWHLKIVDFINPSILDNLTIIEDSDESNGNGTMVIPWFEQKNNYICGCLALQILMGSLNALNVGRECHKYQKLLCLDSPGLIASVAHWVALRGPLECVVPALHFLSTASANNADTAAAVFFMEVSIPHIVEGTTIPKNIGAISLSYGWKSVGGTTHSTSSVTRITVAALLAESYIFNISCWSPAVAKSTASLLPTSNDPPVDVAMLCFTTFEDLLRSDDMVGGVVVQHILAPPPPPPTEEGSEGHEHTAAAPKSIGLLIMNTLLVHVGLAVNHLGNQQNSFGNNNNAHVHKLDIASRATNMFTIVLLHGNMLARELITAISTTRTCIGDESSPGANINQPILLYLMNVVGQLSRSGGALTSSGTDTPALVASLLQLLAVAVAGCESSANQLLGDVSNLFVLKLAAPSTELSGNIDVSVQRSACLLLAGCYGAYPIEESGTDSASVPPAAAPLMSRKRLLSMIESSIGLSRFLELLQLSGKHSYNPLSSHLHQFFTDVVSTFRSSVYDSFANSSMSSDSPEGQMVRIQHSQIQALEAKLLYYEGGLSNGSGDSHHDHRPDNAEVDKMIHDKDVELAALRGQHELSDVQNQQTTRELEDALERNNSLQAELDQASKMLLASQEKLANSSVESDILGYKQHILELDTELAMCKEQLSQRDRKILLLEEELSSVKHNPNERTIHELEVRNAALTKTIWDLESNGATGDQSAVMDVEEKVWAAFAPLINAIRTLGIAFCVNVDSLNALEEVELLSDRNNCFVNEAAAVCDQVVDEFSRCVGKGSDMLEGLVANGMEGDEGSIERLHFAIDTLANVAFQFHSKEDECHVLVSQINILEKDLENCLNARKDFDMEIEVMSRDLDESRRKLVQEVQVSGALQSELVLLKASAHSTSEESVDQLTLIKKHEGTIVKYERQIAEVNRRYELLEAEAGDWKGKLETVHNSESNLSRQLMEKEDKLEQQEYMIEGCKGQLDAMQEQYGEEVRTLNETIHHHKALCEKYAVELQGMTEDNSTHDIRAMDHLKAMNALQQELRQVREEYGTRNKVLHEEQTTLAHTNAQLACQVEEAQQQLDAVLKEKDGCLRDCVELQSRLDTMACTERTLSNEKKEWELACKKAADTHKSELLAMTNSFKKSQDAIEELQQTLTSKEKFEGDVYDSVCGVLTSCGLTGPNDEESLSSLLQRLQQAYVASTNVSAADILHTPPKPIIESPTKSPIKSMVPGSPIDKVSGEVGLLSTPFLSPVKHTMASTPGSLPGSAWKSIMQKQSPGGRMSITKEVAKMHRDVLMERRRLFDLQEEHSDLLGLVAQQEVELSVFRLALEEHVGEASLRLIDEQVQQDSIDRYGSYVNFRN